MAMALSVHREAGVHALQRSWKSAAFVFASTVWLLRHLCKLRWQLPQNAPVVRPHWLLGFFPAMLRAVSRKTHLQFIHNYFKLLGKTFVAWNPTGEHLVLTMDRRNIEHMLKTNFRNYPKGPINCLRNQDLLGTGIFNADGDTWFHQRKTTSHMFTAKLFKEHIWVVVRRNALKVRSILEAAKSGERVDIFNLMNRFTLDSIGEIGFGRSIGSLEDPSSPFLGSFDRAQQNIFYRHLNPFWTLMRCLRVGNERALAADLKLLDDYSRTVVRDLRRRLAEREDGGEDVEARKSFVGLFIEDVRKRGEQPSEDYFRDLVLNFLIAGRDTTAQNLSWAFYCLATHPEVETKARDEINKVCCRREPTYEELKALTYVEALLNESLRLYPSVPIDAKYCLNADTLPDGTVVPGGTNVFYVISSINRDADIWGPDADAFRPERWLKMQSPPDSYTFPAFNAGPRECLGKRLAMVEMKTLVAMILPHVSLRLAVSREQITIDAQMTIGMAAGLPCFVEPVASQPGEQEKASSCAGTATRIASEGATAENEV